MKYKGEKTMSNKTTVIEELVQRALATIANQHIPDIIELVFLKIENDPILYQDYIDLQKIFVKKALNVWIAKYTKKITGMHSGARVQAQRSKLISSYTRLFL